MMTNTETATTASKTTKRADAQGYQTHDVVQMAYGFATITLVLEGTTYVVVRLDRYPSGNYRTYPRQTFATRTKALFHGYHPAIRDARL